MTTIQLPTDPTYWGQDATSSDVERILDTMESMIRSRFDTLEIQFERTQSPRGSRVHGPDDEICDSIHSWIQENWTLAL